MGTQYTSQHNIQEHRVSSINTMLRGSIDL